MRTYITTHIPEMLWEEGCDGVQPPASAPAQLAGPDKSPLVLRLSDEDAAVVRGGRAPCLAEAPAPVGPGSKGKCGSRLTAACICLTEPTSSGPRSSLHPPTLTAEVTHLGHHPRPPEDQKRKQGRRQANVCRGYLPRFCYQEIAMYHCLRRILPMKAWHRMSHEAGVGTIVWDLKCRQARWFPRLRRGQGGL